MKLWGKFLERNTNDLAELIVDTNTFFSAIFSKSGNEAQLFNLADKGSFKIIIFQYVYDELKAVFKRKGVDFGLVIDLLDTFHNIAIEDIEEELTEEEIQSAIELISDPKDRPIFIFVHRKVLASNNVFFVSGDKVFFKENVMEAFDNRVYYTKDFIEKIKAESQ
jgi:predicted nucleic acid-binding protein